MERLSIDDIITNINREVPFHAVSENYSFTLKIDSYVNYVCAAIHDGHQFRTSLWDNCLHTEYDRWYEEDPETKQMITDQPIVLAGLDSRFEYDLNRAPEEAVFETAWGKQLWKSPLSEEERQESLSKHEAFYKVVYALISKIEELHGSCVVYDMHSYNWRRWDREVPTWNLGTKNIDTKYTDIIEEWRKLLSEIKLPHDIARTSAINNTFFGNGYFLKFISTTFKNTLVLATEIAKVYCHEYQQIIFPEVVNAVEEQLKVAISKHAMIFQSYLTD